MDPRFHGDDVVINSMTADSQIDRVANKLYDLTDKEIGIIGGAVIQYQRKVRMEESEEK